jgi:urea carboxylase
VFGKVLIANRGAIACRVIRTLRRMGVASVAVYSEADRNARHVGDADEAIAIGPAPARDSYLNIENLLAAARTSGAQAIHPGYGFLSENALFAERCAAAGLVFIGPSPAQMRQFGLKHTARELAVQSGLPLLPGSGLLAGETAARAAAARVGYPVMLKSTAGGGGIGMQLCADAAELGRAFEAVSRVAASNFSDGGVFIEKYIAHARHIEVQVFGDGAGHVVALGDRDCSLQRRNQKVVEETPAPGLAPALRRRMHAAAVKLMSAVRYASAGTVEFVYDMDARAFYFLEVNTRLQVEHGITEEVTGVDLVEWMVRLAAGESPLPRRAPPARGHAIEARLYAEDPVQGFRPSSGRLTAVRLPRGVRVDSWIETGTEVSPFYDPMLGKVIARGRTRTAAIARLRKALAATRIEGIETNLGYLRSVLRDKVFTTNRHYTRYLGTKLFNSPAIEVLRPGAHTTVQDWPGRIGYWHVGVPPSGPMDPLALRLANRAVGNAEGAAALECTVAGPRLRFRMPSIIALAGARMTATLDDMPVPYWEPVRVAAGQVLSLGRIVGEGQRTCIAIRGGLDVPLYLGSRSTFTLGQFGGHGGRALQIGDVLHVAAARDTSAPRPVPPSMLPRYGSHWRLAVTYGPHGAPDFFTAADIREFFGARWQVHYNSSRTGVRLIGPKPQWARRDGGEAGLHPSNIHDNAYAIGTIDFTGDMPVILGPDGPSLGGFVCPATIATADLWKVGQLRPGDTVTFEYVTLAEAVAREKQQGRSIARLAPAPGAAQSASRTARRGLPRTTGRGLPRGASAIAAVSADPSIVYRQQGDHELLVEFGAPVLDLELRMRAHALMQALQRRRAPGVLELTPGIRSLQVRYDSQRLTQARLIGLLEGLRAKQGDLEALEVPSRIVHLPLSWDDPATRLAIDKYMQSVRPDAPWCPDNIEFIRRINGLATTADVQRIVFDASYLVLGLGDVYLGAPVATPLDPRHRLVTTKYNPARTWTPENAVGIGGAYLCVYGMEGPGGYQFVGRTVQMWNRDRRTRDFARDPWLLRFFDQIRFHPVSSEELLRMRADFPHGRFELQVTPAVLKLREYRAFVGANAASIAAFKSRQQQAFEAERERWRAAEAARTESNTDAGADEDEDHGGTATTTRDAGKGASTSLPEGCSAVAAPVTGVVWACTAEVGMQVAPDQPLLVLEAMKMEIPVVAEAAGTVVEVRAERGRAVTAGDILLVIRENG